MDTPREGLEGVTRTTLDEGDVDGETDGSWAEPGTIDEAWAAVLASKPKLPAPGDRIGQYEVIRELGRGGMGAVLLARDTKLGRRVAIKFLHSPKPDLTARFVLEARATAQCNHDNIVVIHEVGEHEGSPFMVLEYLEGRPLSAELADRGALPPARAIELILPVVRALERAHAHNIVHRDLKPDNIFLTDAGTVKVLDFGIAKLLVGPDSPAGVSRGSLGDAVVDGDSGQPDEVALTQRGMLVGTLPYMSPEQWRGEEIDHRTDIWAVGIILFRMVTGQHPLGDATGRELMITGLLDHSMPSVRDAGRELPDALADVIDACLRKPREQRTGSARALREALESLTPGRGPRRVSGESPYAGLRAFQEADAERFYGRDREIAAAVARLREQPLVGVVGPSGVGKSSFVRAGVIPALAQSGEPWTSLVLRPGRDPIEALAHVIGPMLRSSEATMAGELSEHHDLVERLRAEPGFLGAVLRSRARRRGQRILLFVDQFEELFTLGADERERLAFTACLHSAADDVTTPVRVILSVRSDFLDRAVEDERFMADLSRGLFFLAPPGREAMREALVRPAELVGYRFESERILEDMLGHLAATPGALPLLQFAAAKLWEQRDTAAKLLTEDSYAQLGGIAGALASHADATLAALSPSEQIHARALLLRLVTPERTRAVVPLDELYALTLTGSTGGTGAGQSVRRSDMKRTIDRLVGARLLVVQTGAEAASVELVHESLIHGWPVLRWWLDEGQEDAAFVAQLRAAARQWRAVGYTDDTLWRGEAADEARRFRARFRGELTELERAYLDAVVALASRSTRRRRIAIAAVIGVLSATVVATAAGLVLIREARDQARDQLAEVQAARVERERAFVERERAFAERERALADMQTAQTGEQRANDELVRKNEALSAALAVAEEERANAEASKDRARRARTEAEQRALEAQAARAEQTRLAQALAGKLDEERRRVAELEQQLRELIVNFDLQTGVPTAAEGK